MVTFSNVWPFMPRSALVRGWGCSSVGRASDQHAAEASLIPRCGKGFFSQSQLSVQTLLRCPYTPVCNRMHLHLCARQRTLSPGQSSVDYGNIQTPSMRRRLGNTTLSRLAFPEEATRIFYGRNPSGTIQL